MTQPALSKHIAALEREFGIELIERAHGAIQLTEAGKILFEGANTLVETHDKTKAAINRIKESVPIRIGGQFDDTDVASLMAVIAMTLRNEHNVIITFVRLNDENAFNALSEGIIDIYIDYSAPASDTIPEFACVPFITHKLVAIMSNDHRLANRKSICIEDLQGEPLIKFVSGKTDPAFTQIEALCRKHGFEPKLRSISSASDVEFFSTPLGQSILIWKKGQKQIGLFMRAARRACVAIENDDAKLVSYASYRAQDEEKLAVFFGALKEAKQITTAC